MHEESLVRSLLRQVQEIAVENNAVSVQEIEVEIGELSGVESLLVRSAFDRLSTNGPFNNTELRINEAKLKAVCEGCAVGFQIASFRFHCPECSSTQVRITHGEEFRLLNVTLQTDDDSRDRTTTSRGSKIENRIER